MYVHINKGENMSRNNERKPRCFDNRNRIRSTDSLRYLKGQIDSMAKSLSNVSDGIKKNLARRKKFESSATSNISPPSPRSNFPPSFKNFKSAKTPPKSNDPPSQSPKPHITSPCQSPKLENPLNSPLILNNPKTPPHVSPRLETSPVQIPTSASRLKIKTDLIEIKTPVSSKGEMIDGFKSYFDIKPAPSEASEKNSTILIKEDIAKPAEKIKKKFDESDSSSSDGDDDDDYDYTSEPLVPMKAVPFNILEDELFRVVLLNLPTDTAYDEISTILLSNGFKKNEIEDIMLINQVHQSVATISFEKENLMMRALELNQKITHKERLITIKENRTDSAAKKNTQKCSEVKNRSKRKFLNDDVDTPPRKR